MIDKKTIRKFNLNQILLLGNCKEKWKNILLDTNPINYQDAEKIISFLYKEILNKVKVPQIFVCGSPKEAFEKTLKIDPKLLETRENDHLMRYKIQKSLFKTKNILESKLWEETSIELKRFLINEIRNLSLNLMRIIKNTENTKNEMRLPFFDGYYNAELFAFFDFFINYAKLPIEKPIGMDWYLETYKLGPVYCTDNFCFISDRPKIINMKNNEFHGDGKPAIEFRDGFKNYALNGIIVPKEIAMKPWNELNAKILYQIQNAEVKRELVRKIGIEKVCKDLDAKCIDKWGNYELLLLGLGDGRRRPYLKMLNPSIGTYHIEGVHPEINTVRDALKWRNKQIEKYIKPEKLT